MAQPAWMSAPAVNAPPAQPAWMSAPAADSTSDADPYARQRAEGVPFLPPAPGAAPAPRPQPTVQDRVVGGIQGAMNTAQSVIEGLGGMLGSAGGALGGAIGAIQTRLTGGVQPDSDAVRAVTGPARSGAPDALDESAQQGAQSVVGALQSAGAVGDRLNPVAPVLRAMATPQSQAVAEDVSQRAGEFLSHDVDPYMGAMLHAPTAPANAAARGAGAIDRGLNAAGDAARGAAAATGNAADAAGAAARAGAKNVAAAVVKPDPVLLETARRAGEQFPNLKITPNMISEEGSARKAAGDALDTAPGGHGAAVDTENLHAFNDYLTRAINPEETAGRLTPSSTDGPGTLETAEARAGQGIGDIYAKTPVPTSALEKALGPIRDEAARHGNARVQSDITKAIDQLLALGESGTVDGTALREWNSKLGTDSRRITDPEVAGELADLRSTVKDVVKGHLEDPADATRLDEFNRQYAYAKALEPAVAASKDGLIRPGQLQAILNNSRNGRRFAVVSRGQLQELARVGRVIDPTAAAAPATNSLGKAGRILAGVPRAGAAQVYNRAGPAVTRMLAERPKGEAPPAPPELELAPPGEPLGPGGGGAPAAPGPLGDLTPDWGTTPGAAARAPVPGIDAGPALYEPGPAAPLPQGAGPGREIPAVPGRPGEPDAAPLGDLTPEWGTSPGAGGSSRGGGGGGGGGSSRGGGEPGLVRALGEQSPSTGSRAGERLDVPAAPGRPDLPDTMVVNREGHVFADQPSARVDRPDVKPSTESLESPGARAARESQTRGAAQAEADAARAAAEKEAAKPKANADEQRRLDEIDAQIGQTKSDIVRETLVKARAKVEREIAARDTVEKTKAAAVELRTAAMTMTDPATREALIARADKLDPPPKIPAGETKEGQPPIAGSEAPTKPLPAGKATEGQPDLTPPAPKKPLPTPRVSYLDDPAWRKQHSLGDEDATAALRMREAFDFDPEGVAAAAQKHDTNPKALDAAIAKILEKRDANPGNATPGGSEGTAAEAGKPGESPAAVGAQPGSDGVAAPGSGGQGGQPGGQAEDPHVAAAERARFELAHPRGVDGQFVPNTAPRNLLAEWRAARDKFLAAINSGDRAGADAHEALMNEIADEIRKGK